VRDARAADWLRRLGTQQAEWSTSLHRFALKAIPSIGELEIAIQSPLTVLAGPNGVGKTTLLRAMWAALEPETAGPAVVAGKKLTAGSALIDLTISGAAGSAHVEFSEEGVRPVTRSEVSVQHVDSASYTPAYQQAFCGFASSEELINGAGPAELDSKELAEVSFILNRSYRSVTLYEVDLDGSVPFFEVSYGNDRYDSRTMGAGEMSGLYIWWAVRRAARNSVLLLEEPEAFLSHGCQINLAKHLVSSVVQKRLVAVLSSHAPAFISPLPKESLVFLSRGQAGLALVSDQPPPIVLKQLGIEPPLSAIVFVEDSLARLMARAILERLDPLLSRQIFVDQRNGDGEVISAIRPMLAFNGPMKFIALFDGDLRSSVPHEVVPRSAFLPGNVPVEVAFRAMLADQPNCLALHGLPHGAAVIAALEGKDHHDWYEELARELGLTREQLFSILFGIWIELPGNSDASLAMYTALVALLG
jgi:predicted ATPase